MPNGLTSLSVIPKTLIKKGNYLVVGSFGRKDDKGDPYRIGNTATVMVKLSKTPLIVVRLFVVKKRSKNLTEGRKMIQVVLTFWCVLMVLKNH